MHSKDVKKRSFKKRFISHIRRISLEILNVFINHDWLFWLFGAVNKRINLIESIFIVYPATEKYALAYVYPRRLPKLKWNPWPCGLLLQNWKLTIMFCISSSNGEFTDPVNSEKLKHLAERTEKLRQLFSANRKTFAGILPGILYRKGLVNDTSEADLTAIAVSQALNTVWEKESLEANTPIVVLGGNGFIGKRVVNLLDKNNVVSIDSSDCRSSSKEWPDYLKKQKAVVINITLKDSLREYVDVISPESVVINEVYPEPDSETLGRLRNKSINCYHVVGIDALAIPPFPAAYKGAVPCCAAWPSENLKVVVRKIN